MAGMWHSLFLWGDVSEAVGLSSHWRAWCMPSTWMCTVLLPGGPCLVRSFACLKHLSNTLGTAH